MLDLVMTGSTANRPSELTAACISSPNEDLQLRQIELAIGIINIPIKIVDRSLDSNLYFGASSMEHMDGRKEWCALILGWIYF